MRNGNYRQLCVRNLITSRINTTLAWYMWYTWRLTLQINGPSRQRGDFIVGFSGGLLGGHNSDMVNIMCRVIKGTRAASSATETRDFLYNEMLLPI